MNTNDLTNLENIYLSDEIALVAPRQTPLMTLLLANGKREKTLAKIHSWREISADMDADSTAKEGADAGEGVASKRAELSNICQIFSKTIKVSGTVDATKTSKDIFAQETETKLIELKADIERNLLNATQNDGSDGNARKMNGLLNWAHDDNKVNEAVTEKSIKELAKRLWQQGFEGENIYLFVNADLKEQIDAIYDAKTSYQHKIDQYGVVVNQIETNYGVLNLVLDRYMPADKALALDLDQISLRFLREIKLEKLGKTGDSRSALLVGELTTEVGSKKAVAVLTVPATKTK